MPTRRATTTSARRATGAPLSCRTTGRTRKSSSASPGLPTGWSTTGASGSGVMTCCWTETISTTPPTTRINGISPARPFPARAIRWLCWCTPHRLPFGSTVVFTAVPLFILPHWPPGPGMKEYRRATDYVDEDAGHRIDGYRSCGPCGSVPGVKQAGGLHPPYVIRALPDEPGMQVLRQQYGPPRRNRSFTGKALGPQRQSDHGAGVVGTVARLFDTPDNHHLFVRAGLERSHFSLKPGETSRLPRSSPPDPAFPCPARGPPWFRITGRYRRNRRPATKRP